MIATVATSQNRHTLPKVFAVLKKKKQLFIYLVGGGAGDVSFTADQSGLLLMSFVLFQTWFKFILVCGLCWGWGGVSGLCVFLLFFWGLSEGSVFGSVVLRPSPYRRAFWSFWV